MGSLILCHNKKAEQPYILSCIHKRIYTIEELCYCLCTNLCLFDYSFVSERLCKWLQEELALFSLADGLRDQMKSHAPLDQFIFYILKESGIYSDEELLEVKGLLEKFKNQKDVERQKYKADELFDSGKTEEAILAYRKILNGKRDETVSARFYGEVYACLGAAYGLLFYYKESAKMYSTAFQICEDPGMIKAYLYACRMYMSGEEYHLLLSGNENYKAINRTIENWMQRAKKKKHRHLDQKVLEKWKEAYRKEYI